MSIPLFNIGGIASGLDTNSIVSQLMDLEQIPIRQVENQRALYESRNAAWSQINTRLSAVEDALAALDEPADWGELAAVSSSNPDAVSATVSGSPSPATVSFTVDRLATNHQMASAATGLSSSSDVVGSGTFSITIGGTTYDVTTDGSTTLADLANEISALDVGVSASVLQVDTDQVKLVVAADETGDGSAFTISSDQSALGGFTTIQTGQDAQLTIGSGASPLTVERSNNTIDDLISGVTLDLTATTTGPVTISVGRDLDAAAKRVTTLISAVNSALSTIDAQTRTATESGTVGGPLSSDTTARGLKLSLRSQISGVVGGLTGQYTTSSSVGISLTRTGSVELDETKLREALESDFGAVRALFARTSTTTDARVAVTRAASSSLDGTHAVSITQAGTQAAVTGTSYTPPGTDEVFTVTSGENVANVIVPTGTSLTDAVTLINSTLVGAGIVTLTAESSGGAVRLVDSRFGEGSAFDVSANGLGLAGTHTGTDVAGTIGGVVGDGTGRSLSGAGDFDGLVVAISASAAEVSAAGGTLALGAVSVTSGLASTFAEFLESVTETGGLIDRATDRWDAQITLANDRIDQLEERLVTKEAALRRQFSALESTMAQLQGISSQLLAGLNSLGGLQQ